MSSTENNSQIFVSVVSLFARETSEEAASSLRHEACLFIVFTVFCLKDSFQDIVKPDLEKITGR